MNNNRLTSFSKAFAEANRGNPCIGVYRLPFVLSASDSEAPQPSSGTPSAQSEMSVTEPNNTPGHTRTHAYPLNTQGDNQLKQVDAIVTFKVKIKQMLDGETRRNIVDYKLKVSRVDCNLRPCDHEYYNSDMFPSMLQRAYDKAISGRRWQYLDNLPVGVTIERGAFFSTVSVVVLV